MSWFTRSAGSEMVHQNPHANSDVERLAQVELDFRRAEQDFNTACTAVARYRGQHRENQPFALAGKIFVPVHPFQDHKLTFLEHQLSTAKTRRDSLLAERAELRKSLGLTR